MLAGRIKLRTFLVFLGVVAVFLVGGVFALPFLGCGLFSAFAPDSPPDPPVVISSPVADPPVAAPTVAPVAAQRPIDVDVLSFVGKDLGTDKVKDAVPGRAYKINAYQDAGHHSANRLKVDLNRNDKWDEKYTLEDGKITREVAPADDENYTEKSFWNGSTWGAEGAPNAAPAANAASDPTAAALSAAREVDRVVLGYRGKSLGTDKLKDVTSGQVFKVNVYQDAGQATANRAKVDLDRDDKWDEKYTFRADGTEREVAPADDESYTEVWVWTDAGWKRK